MTRTPTTQYPLATASSGLIGLINESVTEASNGEEAAQPTSTLSGQIAIQDVAERCTVIGRQVGEQLVGDIAGNQAFVASLFGQLESSSCEPSLLGVIQIVLIEDAFEFLL
jgi:hypothetical protein